MSNVHLLFADLTLPELEAKFAKLVSREARLRVTPKLIETTKQGSQFQILFLTF